MKRDRLDMEIESIENDDSLTNEEKYNEIRDIERDYESMPEIRRKRLMIMNMKLINYDTPRN